MNRTSVAHLTAEERSHLQQLISSGSAPARKIRRAHILRTSDCSPQGPKWRYQALGAAFDVSATTGIAVRRADCDGGLEAALHRKQPAREYPHRLDGAAEVYLIALACSQSPKGHACRRLRLLRDRFSKAVAGERVSHATIRQVFKKRPETLAQDTAFVCQMEEVLEVYQRPDAPQRPLGCMNDRPHHLLDVHDPLPIGGGQPRREDDAYERNGVSTMVLFFEPLAGQRYLWVSERRTSADWAHAMRDLADGGYPQAEVIVGVMDSLNTHSPASVYEAFAPAEARRLYRRVAFHSTPRHGRWLHMAEIEVSALVRTYLNRRIPDQATLWREAQA